MTDPQTHAGRALRRWPRLIRAALLGGVLLFAGAYHFAGRAGWLHGGGAVFSAESLPAHPSVSLLAPDDGELTRVFASHRSGVQVHGSGVVSKVLKDDTQGSRHQRFILRTDSGHTVLIAHNIDLAPRIADLSEGAHVEFAGEYAWNEKGGLVHFTHHDPSGHHPAGWLKVAGILYR